MHVVYQNIFEPGKLKAEACGATTGQSACIKVLKYLFGFCASFVFQRVCDVLVGEVVDYIAMLRRALHYSIATGSVVSCIPQSGKGG